jgi:plasmid maintenance system antidote protein VapI
MTAKRLNFALTLEKVLGTTAEMWVRIQADYDLWVARKKAAQGDIFWLKPRRL